MSTSSPPARRVPGRRPRTRWPLLPLAAIVFAWACLASCRPAGPGNGSPTEPPEPPDGEPTVSIALAWDPPTTDAEGNPLDDLVGYRLYFGTRAPLSQVRDMFVEVGTRTTYELEGLAPGTWFFAITAVDENGNESAFSNEVGAELEAP